MSSSVFETFNLDLRQRRWERAMAMACILACAAVPWLLRDLALLGQAAMSLAAGAAAAVGAHRVGWLGRSRLVSLVRSAAGRWHLRHANGVTIETELAPTARFFRHFLWLQFASRHGVLLGPGDVPPEQFRRLQVQVRRRGGRAATERVA